jgi:hypothetical protein
MFRRIRYKRWLVAGLGVAALVFPVSALAGNSSSKNGTQDGWYPWAVSVTQQAQNANLDLRSPDTVDAALAAHPKLDPAIVAYLEHNGYTRNQIDAMAQPLRVSQPKLDPMIVKYLEKNGYTRSQIFAMAKPLAVSQPKIDPMIVLYLEKNGYTRQQIFAMAAAPARTVTSPKTRPTLVDGRSPDTVDFAVQAHAPVVTVTRDAGFQWGDFGIGLCAALLVLVALGIIRLFSNRGGQRPVTTG